MSSKDGAALSLRLVQRQLAALLPEGRPAGAEERSLELASYGNDAPRLASATILDGGAMQARRVFDPPVPGFRAFLDGTQRSEAARYLRGVPIVLGHAAAVIRERRNRRMHTWLAPLVERRIYCPRAAIPAAAWQALVSLYGAALVDTSDDEDPSSSHPLALRGATVRRVESHRRVLEQRLAERWCSTNGDPLFIDGGISGSTKVATSRCSVGVVKSHGTLYAEGTALDVVLGLPYRHRSSVFLITSSPPRAPVASFYLRLRDPSGHDQMWGLVRVEFAAPAPDAADRIGERADEVARWILAEASPLALPDARWDKMVYGVRDCEEFLRAIS